MKRSLFCTFILLLLLTACGQQGDTPPAAEKLAYRSEYHSFVLECERVDTGCVVDGGLCLLDRRRRMEFSWSGAVTRVSLDGTLTEIFSADRCMEEEYAAVGPQALCAGEDDTFWLLLDCTAERENLFTDEILLCWNSGDTIWGWNEEAGAGEAVLDKARLDVNLDSNLLRCFAALEDGRLAAVTWNGGLGSWRCSHRRTPESCRKRRCSRRPAPICPAGCSGM